MDVTRLPLAQTLLFWGSVLATNIKDRSATAQNDSMNQMDKTDSVNESDND